MVTLREQKDVLMTLQSAEIMDAVLRQPPLLVLLFSPPARPQPTDSVMSSFFARVVAHLMSHRGVDLMSWLKVDPSCPEIRAE